MKHIVLSVFLFLSIVVSAAEPIKIGVISDTHYLSENLMDNGFALQEYLLTSGKNVKDVPAVLDKVLADYLQSDIQILLISGDITKDGEKQSHLDFVEKLKPLQDKGVRVFVVPGNHDINMPNAVEFKGNKKNPVTNVSPKEFIDLYADCGYSDAIRRDTISLSYVASLGDKTWLLAIDAARYREYNTSIVSGGKILPGTEKWIVDILDEARSKGIQVIGMMHWGLTEHIIYQSSMFRDYLVYDWQRLAGLFADKGMKAIFTGHFHSNDISAFTSNAGNTIYDIETGTLSAYPFSYRFIELSSDSMKVETKNIVSIPQNPNLAEDDKLRMQKLSEKLALQKIKNMGYDFPDKLLVQFANILGRIFILHAYGDEKVDGDLEHLIEQQSAYLEGSEMDLDIELDFPPADNNVTLYF